MSVSGISSITPVDPKRESLAVQQVAPSADADHDNDKGASAGGESREPASSGHKVDVRV